jgi:hypothetical protein
MPTGGAFRLSLGRRRPSGAGRGRAAAESVHGLTRTSTASFLEAGVSNVFWKMVETFPENVFRTSAVLGEGFLLARILRNDTSPFFRFFLLFAR